MLRGRNRTNLLKTFDDICRSNETEWQAALKENSSDTAYEMLLKDACSGIAFLDDNQIVKVSAEKIQCAQGEAPFTRIRFKELEELS